MGDDIVIGAFGEDAAARLSNLSLGQLRTWDKTGFFRPSFGSVDRHQPYSRVYSFRDIVSLRVLGQLRNTLKVPMQHLRKVSEKLIAFGDAKWTATTLYVLGKRVVFKDPNTDLRTEIVSGQHVFNIPLLVVISDTKHAISKLNCRSSSEIGKIVQTKFTLQNEPVFTGTRISVKAVKRYLDAGYEPAAVVKEFPELTLQDIEAAKTFDDGKHAA